MTVNTANTDDTGSIEVSDHAVLRWLARVNPTEQSPRTAIRDAWRRGRRAAVEHGRGRTDGNAVLVECGGTITTVMEARQ